MKTIVYILLFLAIFSEGLLSNSVLAQIQAEKSEVDIVLYELGWIDLFDVEVVTVSKKKESVFNTAAAVFVVTQESIRRSGATSIPEALRYVPGLQVAQSASHTWEITSRGFNGQYANKLLVLIDGRSVYTPLFSGVFWELQDTMIEDIERIEVIRGPGAAMWGANAVNGVINVITKKAEDTQGNLIVAGAGNQERGFAGLRHGGSFKDSDGNYRIYAKGFSRDETVSYSGQDQDDDWRSGQIGFRMDYLLAGGDRLSLQGDAYHMDNGTPLISNTVLVAPYTSYTPDDAPANGGNLMARGERTLLNGSEMSLQAYYDRVKFDSLFVGNDTETYDLDFQYRLHPNASNDLMWGVNYRHINNEMRNTAEYSNSPSNISYENVSFFAQDDITLVADRLRLTLGAKLEDNHFGGDQFQPNARLLWTADDKNSVWLSASRASRTPSINESTAAFLPLFVAPPSPATFNLPMQGVIVGNPDLKAEKVTALEAGYRAQWSESLSTDIAVYANTYRDLVQVEFDGVPALGPPPVPHLVAPMIFTNATEKTRTRGLEISVDWRPLNWMRLEGAFTYTTIDAPPWDGLNNDFARLVPRTHESLRCLMNLSDKTNLNLALRHVGSIDATNAAVDAYTTVDVNMDYEPRKGLVLSLVGNNVFKSKHAEYITTGQRPSQIPRSIYAKVTWDF